MMANTAVAPEPIFPAMTSARTLPFAGLVIFLVLSLIDLSLTWFLLSNSGGRVYESNPIADAWLASYGWAGLVIYKVAGLILVASVILFVSYRQPQTGRRLLAFAICALTVVAFYSYYLLVNMY